MKLLECLENGAFNELITFSFEEVKWMFDQHIYFVPNDKEIKVVDEAATIEKWYKEGLERINKYEEEYSIKINQGEEVPEFKTPQYMVRDAMRFAISHISPFFLKALISFSFFEGKFSCFALKSSFLAAKTSFFEYLEQNNMLNDRPNFSQNDKNF